MNIWSIVLRSLRQHLLSTCVTAFSVALATGLLMSVWTVKDESRKTFTQVTGGFDAVLGPRSSELQLVLNSIFHLESSPGNISLEDYASVTNDPRITLAAPIAVGDNYRGVRIVGTTTNYFQTEYAPGKKYDVEPDSDWFDPLRREAVVGSYVAKQLGLKVGDEFHPNHGVTFNEEEEHEEHYLVIGILKPSNTPADKVIWIPLEGLQKMSGHAIETHEQISAVLLKFTSPMAARALQLKYQREDTRFTLAWPIGNIVAQLFSKIGWFDKLLAAVAALVALVACASVMASIYNSMNERRREIAIMRALGARRADIFTMVVLEAIFIVLFGILAGYLVHLGIMFTAAHLLQAQTGVVLNPFSPNAVLWLAPLALLLAGALSGVVPAIKAYRTDVASSLQPHS